MITADQLKPGTVFEWAYTPNFGVSARMVVDRLEPDYAWVHFEDSGTVNRLWIEAIQRHGRLVK